MEPQLPEILDALNHINDKIRPFRAGGILCLLKLITDGKNHRITFCDEMLWQSGDEICLFYDTPEGLRDETFEEALSRNAFEVIESLQGVSLEMHL